MLKYAYKYKNEMAQELARKMFEIYGDGDPDKAARVFQAVDAVELIAEDKRYEWTKQQRIESGEELPEWLSEPLQWHDFHTSPDHRSKSAGVPIPCEGKYGGTECSYFALVEHADRGLRNARATLNFNQGYYENPDRLISATFYDGAHVQIYPRRHGSGSQYLGDMPVKEIESKMNKAENAEEILDVLIICAEEDWKNRREIVEY